MRRCALPTRRLALLLASATCVVACDMALGLDGLEAVDPDDSTVCDAQYDDLAGYVFCEQTASQCEFRVLFREEVAANSCDEACQARGGSCANMWTNDEEECRHGTNSPPDGCKHDTSDDGICLCSRD